MIDADKRKAVCLLHKEGMGGREIARRLGLGRNTVQRVIALGGALPLERLKSAAQPAGGGTLFEQAMLKDLELAQKYLQRVSAKSHDPRLASAAFRAQAQLLLAGLLSRAPVFLESVRELHDRCGQA